MKSANHLPGLAERDTFSRMMGIKLIEWKVGKVVTECTVGKDHLNFNGTCHGGVLFAVADVAFGFASNSHGIISAGINVHMVYPAAAREGDTLRATAIEASRSRRLATYQVEVTRQDGEVVGLFTGTVFVTENLHDGAAVEKSVHRK
ncbi:MAG: hotdog fold thioesterase [Alphaproteobacteria bacterium]|nr:hotdog fold thioesterase [Alphaproteobacteria bacterium]